MAYRPSSLFRTRNILGVALIAGIWLGIYLKDIFRFGTGGDGFLGLGKSGDNSSSITKAENRLKDDDAANPDDSTDEIIGTQTPAQERATSQVIKVLIDDRQFLLRDGKTDQPIALPKLIGLIKDAPGDADGVRVRIYQKLSARVSAEEQLKEALAEAQIPDAAIFWVPSTGAK